MANWNSWQMVVQPGAQRHQIQNNTGDADQDKPAKAGIAQHGNESTVLATRVSGVKSGVLGVSHVFRIGVALFRHIELPVIFHWPAAFVASSDGIKM
jgi:hypothetical protein